MLSIKVEFTICLGEAPTPIFLGDLNSISTLLPLHCLFVCDNAITANRVDRSPKNSVCRFQYYTVHSLFIDNVVDMSISLCVNQIH